MSGDYEKWLQFFKKRNLSVVHFSDYLYFQEQPSFITLSQYLTQHQIDLKEYYQFLNRSVPSVQNTSSAPTIVHEQELIQKISLNLLTQQRISLDDLNKVLSETSTPSTKIFLQKLLVRKSIQAEEFVSFVRGDWKPETTSSDYQVQRHGNTLKFQLVPQRSGTKIGPYTLYEELGRGAAGIVYKAHHSQLNQIVALKVLIAGEDASEKMLQRFHREIQTMAQLNHPGIVQILNSGIEGHLHYFSMEFVSGSTLETMTKKSVPVRKKIKWIQTVLTALEYAHQKNIIHRDLKLENIFITSNEETKIGDFGLARTLDLAEEHRLTQSGAILGTAYYMSPEQAKGETRRVDTRSDIYSVGVCLYKLLTQRYPFEASSRTQLLHQVITSEPFPPSQWNKHLHPDLDTILLKALEKSPEKRYPTAQDFADDLERFLSGAPILACPLTYTQKGIRWFRSHQQRASSIMILVVALISCILFFHLSEIQKRKQGFQFLWNQIVDLENQANAILPDQFTQRTEKLKFLLQSFNKSNEAILLETEVALVEAKKWNLGKELIQFACKEKSYELAFYVARELKSISSFPESEKESLLQYIESEKNQTRNRHQKRFQYWLKKLDSPGSTDEQRQEAIFEVSQMNEKEIVQELLQLLESSTDYVLPLVPEDSREKIRFYCTWIQILGRMENQALGEPLFQTMKKVSDHFFSAKKARTVEDVDYLATLVQALANLKKSEYVEAVRELRLGMGQNGVFWDRTQLAYQKLVQQKPLASTTEEVVDFYKRAYLKYEQKNFSGTILDLNRALKQDPHHENAYLYRALAKNQLKDYHGALEDLATLLKINPKNEYAYATRGSLRQNFGDWAGALTDYNSALKLIPNDAYTYNNRGCLKKSMGDLQGALEDFNKTIEIDLQYVDAYSNRGLTRLMMGDFSGALEDCNLAIRLNPQESISINTRGYANMMLGKLNEAIADFDHSLRLNPNFAEAYQNRGTFKLSQKDHAGAIQDFNEALRLKPILYQTYYMRGLAYSNLQQKKEGLHDFQKYLELTQHLRDPETQNGRQFLLEQFPELNAFIKPK